MVDANPNTLSRIRTVRGALDVRSTRKPQRGALVKIQVLLKDPDTMHDAVDDAVKKLERPAELHSDEWADVCEGRAQDIKSQISSRWMEYGEYLCVEFDTDANTATVIPNNKR